MSRTVTGTEWARMKRELRARSEETMNRAARRRRGTLDPVERRDARED